MVLSSWQERQRKTSPCCRNLCDLAAGQIAVGSENTLGVHAENHAEVVCTDKVPFAFGDGAFFDGAVATTADNGQKRLYLFPVFVNPLVDVGGVGKVIDGRDIVVFLPAPMPERQLSYTKPRIEPNVPSDKEPDPVEPPDVPELLPESVECRCGPFRCVSTSLILPLWSGLTVL